MTAPFLLTRNPLVFPGGNPGFDPRHVASRNTVLSAVAMTSKNYLNVLNGTIGAVNGTPNNFAIDGIIGAAPLASTISLFTFAGITAATTFPSVTIAGIIRTPATVSGEEEFFQSSGTDNAYKVGFSAGVFIVTKAQVTQLNTTIPTVANSPYFVVFSSNEATSTINVVVRNLNTGQVFSQVIANGSASTATNGTVSVGSAANAAKIGTAVAMYSTAFVSMAALQQWAAAPWKFWYPTGYSAIAFDIATIRSGDTFGNEMRMLMM